MIFDYANHAHVARKGDSWITVKTPLTPEQHQAHLDGKARYGVPFIKQGTFSTRLAMIDIDDHDGSAGWELVCRTAERILDITDRQGLKGNCYRSGGGKGINIWFFWEQPQRASRIKDAFYIPLLEAEIYDGAGGIVNGQVEIFPKQRGVGKGEVGNCASLPRIPLDVWAWDDLPVGSVEFEYSEPVTDDDGLAPYDDSGGVTERLSESQIKELLQYVPNPDDLDYDSWWQRIMAIHDAGGTLEIAENWSRKSAKHVEGYLERKWRSIKGDIKRTRVTVKTLYKIASDNGWEGFGAVVDDFPVAVHETTGDLLVDYERVPGKGRYAGRVESSLDQVCQCVESDPEYPWRVSFDQFLNAEIVEHEHKRHRLLDHHAVEMRRWFDRAHWEPVGADMIRAVIESASKRNQTNIAKDWLLGLQWDGVDRYQRMLEAMGVVVNDYTLAVARYQWTSHAARVLHAGYQADAIIVLVSSKQGTGKTQYIRAISPTIGEHDTYQNVSIDDLLHSDKAARALMGCLVANIDEMRDFGKREAAEIKAALSRTKESFVPKYKEGRREFGRSCMIYATNNEVEFLDDPTGNRRYHIYPVGDIDLKWVRENAEQLWAQGRSDFEANGQAWKRALELAEPAQQHHQLSDASSDAIEEYLKTSVVDTHKTSEIMINALQLPVSQHDRRSELRVGRIMREFGWTKRVVREGDALYKGWQKEE